MMHGTTGDILEAHRKLAFVLQATLEVIIGNHPSPFPPNPIVCALLLGATASAIDVKKEATENDRNTYYGDLCFLAATQDEALGNAIGTVASAILQKQISQN